MGFKYWQLKCWDNFGGELYNYCWTGYEKAGWKAIQTDFCPGIVKTKSPLEVGHDVWCYRELTSDPLFQVGMEIEVRPGLVSKDSEGKLTCRPIFSRIVSLYTEQNELQYAVPGGLIGKFSSSSNPIFFHI